MRPFLRSAIPFHRDPIHRPPPGAAVSVKMSLLSRGRGPGMVKGVNRMPSNRNNPLKEPSHSVPSLVWTIVFRLGGAPSAIVHALWLNCPSLRSGSIDSARPQIRSPMVAQIAHFIEELPTRLLLATHGETSGRIPQLLSG